MKLIEFYRDAAGLYRWRIIARNGKIVGASSQGYKHHKSMAKNFYDLIVKGWGHGLLDYEVLDLTKAMAQTENRRADSIDN